ncbi:PDZ domain-containing protein [Flavobacterium sp.]|uniref:PDZ domain-containing protein n=1 Tax=Flavobacterium sp. TaxID=239 RepID=UPI003750DD3C
MKNRSIHFFLIFLTQIVWAQDGFHFENNKSKTTITFQFVNNLIIIPIEVNGVTLNFLLDSGVQESILFSINDTEEINFSQVEKVKIRGFGSNESFDGFKSFNNKLSIKNYTDFNHIIYLVLDQNINISFQIGIPVNGIIGYHFFKNNKIKINYETHKITIYKNSKKLELALNKKYTKIPIQLIDGKPYVNTNSFFENNQQSLESKLLIDTGNNDAVWFFKHNNDKVKIPKLNFEDFLGKGFSGDVFGKRARIEAFKIGDFMFIKPLVAFPDAVATTEIDKVEGRLGSIGSEIMRRFTVVFDYNLNFIYLKKNDQYDQFFNFNMSGIDVQHQGLQWIQEKYEDFSTNKVKFSTLTDEKIDGNFKYKFQLKPLFVIANIRKDSPADRAGLKKEDIILKINNQNAYNYSLQKINDLLKSEEGRTIEFEIERKGKILNFKFQLKSLL